MDKEEVLQLARKKYKSCKKTMYGISSISGSCLIEAFLEISGYTMTWSDAKEFLVNNFGMVCDDLYNDAFSCRVFLKDFKLEQKTLKNE